jgi:hypothetical protein
MLMTVFFSLLAGGSLSERHGQTRYIKILNV